MAGGVMSGRPPRYQKVEVLAYVCVRCGSTFNGELLADAHYELVHVNADRKREAAPEQRGEWPGAA